MTFETEYEVGSSPGNSVPIASYALVGAVLSSGLGAVFTLLAEFRDRFGFSESGAGTIAAVGFLASFLSQLTLAPLADRGHARTMLRVGVACATLGMAGMVVATQLWQFILSRLAFGLASGAVNPALRRAVITSDPDNVGRNLGFLAAADMSGFVVGPALAAALNAAGGIRLPFIAMTVANLGLCVVVTRLWVPPVLTPGTQSRRSGYGLLLRQPAIQAMLLAVVAFAITIGFFEATWALLLDDRGASTMLIGLSLSGFSLPMMFLSPAGGRIAQRVGHSRVVAASIGTATLCTLGYGWFDPIWALLLLALVHSLADAFTLPANLVGIALAAPTDLAATAQGLTSATMTLIGGLSALTCGNLYDGQGPRTVYSVAAVAMAVCLGASLLRSHQASAARSG